MLRRRRLIPILLALAAAACAPRPETPTPAADGTVAVPGPSPALQELREERARRVLDRDVEAIERHLRDLAPPR